MVGNWAAVGGKDGSRQVRLEWKRREGRKEGEGGMCATLYRRRRPRAAALLHSASNQAGATVGTHGANFAGARRDTAQPTHPLDRKNGWTDANAHASQRERGSRVVVGARHT